MSNNQTQNWTAATFTSQGLPAPAGSNENGEPHWIIDGKQISWQEMQQAVWQQRQQQPSGGGRGFEGMPSMPAMNFEMPSQPESGVEKIASPERSIERSVENSVEKQAEQGVNRPTNQPKQAKPAKKQQPAASLIGQSAPLKRVKPNDPVSMYEHYQSNKNNKNVKDSNAFLGKFFHKLLGQLASSTIGK